MFHERNVENSQKIELGSKLKGRYFLALHFIAAYHIHIPLGF